MTNPHVIGVSEVSKSFDIPSIQRSTIREHALNLFARRKWERLEVLKNINFAVGPGETLGLMGRNGSGKSTLLRILAGIYPPDSGNVSIRGSLTPILELGVGFNGELTVEDNVYLMGTVMGLSLQEVRDSMEELLEFAELTRFTHQKVQHLSSGMIARLAYGIAFRAVGEILLLDEIFAVGDADFQARCEQQFRALVATGRTIVLVSHDAEAVARLCHRAILLEHGQVAADGPSADVADEYLARASTAR